MNQSRPNTKSDYKDINIFTLLSNESTKEAEQLLAKYGKQKASGYVDLEKKLTDVYFKTPQKVEMEREMVEIHPHKNWILKHIKPTESRNVVNEVVVEDKIKSNGIQVEPAGYLKAEGDCDCPECQAEKAAENYYNASGDCDCHSSTTGTPSAPKKNHTPIIVAGIVTFGAVAITGLVLYFRHKNKKA